MSQRNFERVDVRKLRKGDSCGDVFRQGRGVQVDAADSVEDGLRDEAEAVETGGKLLSFGDLRVVIVSSARRQELGDPPDRETGDTARANAC